jgi:Uma2 family endonuclease
LEGHGSLRITYDRGDLELMVISRPHEHYRLLLARFVEVAAEEMGMEVDPGGNMTFQREDLERGLESDDCFWIAHEPAMRGKMTWDPLHDPPPDLVLEIEISRSALKKMEVYSALRVPEIWCFDGLVLAVYVLRADGTYEQVERSPTFSSLPLEEIARFVRQAETAGFLSVVREFRAWVRQQLDKQP